jgi:hypothetical protein
MRQWKKAFDNADDYANDLKTDLDEDDLDMFEGDDSFEDLVLKKTGIKTVKK